MCSRSSASCEPMVPRSAWRSVDTRAYRPALTAGPCPAVPVRQPNPRVRRRRAGTIAAASAATRGSSCGVQAGRAAARSSATNTGSAAGQAINPASPRRANRAAARPTGSPQGSSTCAPMFRRRPAPPRPAARTTGCSPPAHPLDGAPVQPHAEPVGHLLGDLGPRPGVGADKVHDLRP